MHFYVRAQSSRLSARSSGFTPCMPGFLKHDWLSLSIYTPITQDPAHSSAFTCLIKNRLISTLPFLRKQGSNEESYDTQFKYIVKGVASVASNL